MKRIDELVELLQQYDYQYHVLDKPTVSDAVYDSLRNELKQLEADHPEQVRNDSPTRRLRSELISEFSKVEHRSRMYSLNDVFNRQDVEAWVERMTKLAPSSQLEFFADIKMDGLACSIIYQEGQFVQAVTRGDGLVGEDVTDNVRTIKNVPLRLNSNKKTAPFLTGRTEIRGEIVMYKDDFAKLNKSREAAGLPAFANPRNLAAGTIRQLDPQLVAARPLKFRAYDLIRKAAAEVPTNMFAYDTIHQLGLAVNQQAKIFKSINQVMQFVDHWESKRHQLPFNTDGLVVKINDRRLYQELGFVGKNPRGAVAYKYPAEQATTIVKDIVISIGRTGAATPVAVFDPVVVAGTTVQHASLHNADEIERRDIRVGDTVVIYKAGDIIPQVEKVVAELRPKNAKKFNMVNELARQYPELKFSRPEGEAVYRVVGDSGPLILKRALQHFASKGAMDIDTLGEKNVEALVDAELVADLADIYQLTKQQILGLERFAELSATNLIEAVAAKKNPPLARFIYGLGIRHVGVQTAIDLSLRYRSLAAFCQASIDDLKQVEGVGEIVAESIVAWLSDDDNQRLLAKFESLGVKPQIVDHVGGRLSGKSFVVTGTLETMGRDIAAEKVRALGGTFQSAVGKDTSYLVMGAKAGASKADKARKLGTEVIDEQQFRQLLGEK